MVKGVKLSEEEKQGKQAAREAKKFICTVTKFLSNKCGGELPPEWSLSLVLLETYYKQFLQMNAEIDNLDSLCIMSKNGLIPNPILTARDKAAIRLEALMRELGLTLKAASKLEIIDTVQEESPLDSFVKGKVEKR